MGIQTFPGQSPLLRNRETATLPNSDAYLKAEWYFSVREARSGLSGPNRGGVTVKAPVSPPDGSGAEQLQGGRRLRGQPHTSHLPATGKAKPALSGRRPHHLEML